MNETRGNARTKPMYLKDCKNLNDYQKMIKNQENFQKKHNKNYNKALRENLKEREINSLKDSEKTNELRIKGCLLHNSDLWKTPKFIYNYYVIKHNYFDPCPVNPQFDGLQIEWKTHNFVNPPYSQIDKWIEKAIEERSKNKASILLVPSRTDTKWFRKILENDGQILFIQGRLHFNDKGPAPFPSMFVIFEPIKLTDNTFGYITKEDLTKEFK